MTKQNFLNIFTGLFAVALIIGSVHYVYAHGGDSSLIHACVKNNGSIRIVGPNENCKNNETPLDWNITGPQGPAGESGSTGGYIASRLAGADLQNLNLNYRDFSNVDFSGTNFIGSTLNYSDFKNADFRTTVFGPGAFGNSISIQYGDLSGANFSGNPAVTVDFSFSNLTGTDFSNATISNGGGEAMNLTNANFTNTHFTQGSMYNSTTTGANFTGATWDGFYCVDGTFSNDNGGTCVGHLGQ